MFDHTMFGIRANVRRSHSWGSNTSQNKIVLDRVLKASDRPRNAGSPRTVNTTTNEQALAETTSRNIVH